MPSLGRFIAASTDDAHENRNNTVYSDSATVVALRRSFVASVAYTGGFRFLNITIPNAATILSAKLLLRPNSAVSDDMAMVVHCHDVDNSATFAVGDSPFDREGAVTTASVTWTQNAALDHLNADGYFESPDLTGPVQEVIARGGWSSGNALTFILIPQVGGTKRCDVRSYDFGGLIPGIEIEWVGTEVANAIDFGAAF